MQKTAEFVSRNDYRCWCGERLANRVCHQMFGRQPFVVMVCASCRTHRILPKAVTEEYGPETLYNEYEGSDVSLSHEQQYGENMLRRFNQIQLNFNSKLKVLDVGCGIGVVLDFICDRFGCEGKGIDVDKRRIAVAQARAKRAKFECGMFSPGKDAEKYDVVLATAVLEHVVDPVRFLEDLNSVLAPEGELFLLTPNASSLNYRLLGSWWRELLSIGEHIYLFTPASLGECASRAGLRILNLSSDYDFQFPGFKFGSLKQLVINGWWVYREMVKAGARCFSNPKTGDILYARLKKSSPVP